MPTMNLAVSFLICFGWIAFSSGQNTCGDLPSPGLDLSRRIIGGVVTEPDFWPWQLAIETDNGSTFNLHCGGVLIGDSWALTAAHCVTPRPGQLLAIGGLYDRTQPITGTQIRVFTQEHITYHPDFTVLPPLNDLAIIHFPQPFDLSTSKVKTICLPPDSSVSYIENPNCYLTGWGLTEAGGALATALKRISIDVISDLHCFGRTNNRTVQPSETCTFDEVSRTETPCDGDMGGPLSCVVNGRFYVAGVGSFTIAPQCDARIPQIYSKIPYFVDWIKSVTGL